MVIASVLFVWSVVYRGYYGNSATIIPALQKHSCIPPSPPSIKTVQLWRTYEITWISTNNNITYCHRPCDKEGPYRRLIGPGRGAHNFILFPGDPWIAWSPPCVLCFNICCLQGQWCTITALMFSALHVYPADQEHSWVNPMVFISASHADNVLYVNIFHVYSFCNFALLPMWMGF